MRHRLPPERLDLITLPPEGLDEAAAASARQQYGSNDLLGQPTGGWRAIATDTARDPMLWFLLATALLFALIGDYLESIVLALALLPILGMDAWLHWRTQASTAGLASRISAVARVIRNGQVREIPSLEVVPGDLLEVRAGEHAAADGVVVSGEGVQLDESALTGESLPARKRPGPLSGQGEGIDHAHWIAAGTRVLSGTARMRVLMTGADTLYGGIVRSTQASKVERTPLQKSLDGLVARLVIASVVLCIALAATRLVQGHGLVDALVSGATLAIAALPEEFPVAFTVFLGVGVYRLARRQALVRRAAVVENIGRVSCLCTDKTGTLTEGALRLGHVMPAADVTEQRLLAAAAGASREEGGDPMDSAVLERAPCSEEERVASFPFTEQRRRESAALRRADGGVRVVAKGAPETILGICALGEVEQAHWRDKVAGLAAGAHKAIACAERAMEGWDGTEPGDGYTFLGLLAFEDPLRAGAADTVRAAQAAGLRLIMVTGDHPATAEAIAAESGLGATPPRVIEGEALEQALHDDGRLRNVDVVARCMPAQKLALVQALQRNGEVVAVTGDGVNDVPALAAADVGIAMGQRGTRSAREAASIVLLDDDLRSLVSAIAEGRQLFTNLQLAFAYLLLVHIPLVLTAALVPFAGLPLLYLPIHIVWLELLIHPTMLLVFQELPGSGTRALPARGRRLQFFDAGDWWLIAGAGLLLTVLIGGSYAALLAATGDALAARTTAMVALAVVSAGAVAGLSGLRTPVARIVLAATLLSTFALVQTPAISGMLHLRPLTAGGAALALLAGLISWVFALRLARRLRIGDTAPTPQASVTPSMP